MVSAAMLTQTMYQGPECFLRAEKDAMRRKAVLLSLGCAL